MTKMVFFIVFFIYFLDNTQEPDPLKNILDKVAELVQKKLINPDDLIQVASSAKVAITGIFENNFSDKNFFRVEESDELEWRGRTRLVLRLFSLIFVVCAIFRKNIEKITKNVVLLEKSQKK